MLSWIFEKVVMLMVAYFIMSIINSMAQSYHRRVKEDGQLKKSTKEQTLENSGLVPSLVDHIQQPVLAFNNNNVVKNEKFIYFCVLFICYYIMNYWNFHVPSGIFIMGGGGGLQDGELQLKTCNCCTTSLLCSNVGCANDSKRLLLLLCTVWFGDHFLVWYPEFVNIGGYPST